MENKTLYDTKRLIKLLRLSTPDSLNVAEAILKTNHEIDIPKLPQLRQAVYRSLAEKENRQLSQEVREIKSEIIASMLPSVSMSI